MSAPIAVNDLNAFAEALERRTLELIGAQNWPALEAMIAPECQFVTHTGVYDKAAAMTLMQGMQLTGATLKDLKATAVGDTVVVSFYLACSELINGEVQSREFSPRLSIWKKASDAYRCIAYGDFNQA